MLPFELSHIFILLKERNRKADINLLHWTLVYCCCTDFKLGTKKSHHEILSEKQRMNLGKICRISQGFCYFEKQFQCQSQWAIPFPLYGCNEHLILHFLLWLRCRKLELHSCVSRELVQVNSRDCFLITL